MSKKRLTVILGAGSLVELGYPTTAELTKSFNQVPEIAALTTIWKHQVGFPEKPFHFEDAFHIVRELYRINGSKGRHGLNNTYYTIIKNCIKIIRSSIIEAETDTEVKLNTDYSWYENFWKRLSTSFNLDIISLNYDAIFEDSNVLTGKLITGFDTSDGLDFAPFDDKLLVRNVKSPIDGNHTLSRLHGCVKFGIAHIQNDTFSNNNQYYKKIFCCDKNRDVFEKPGSTGFETIDLPHGEIRSTIITGHNKLSAMEYEPYKTYYSLLNDILNRSEGILTIGYGFNSNDSHLNKVLDKSIRRKQKLVLCNIGYSIKQDEKCMRLDFQEHPHLEFYDGFRDASQNYLDQIISFFKDSSLRGHFS